MDNREDNLETYIGEPGLQQDLAALTQTGHVSEYYNTRMDRMRSLMSGQDVTVEERAAYDSEIRRYTILLHQMRHDGHLLNTGQVQIHDAGWVQWHREHDGTNGI